MGCSLMAHICKTFIQHFLSMNPERVEHPEKVMMMLEMFKSKNPNVGFKREDLKTPNGAKYEVHSKKNTPKNGRVVLYLHGGGYCSGLISLYRKLSKDFAKAWDATEVYFLDYDCAPKAVYPTQQNQALDLWDYMINTLGYKEENIIVGGDSAGGNLTLNLMLNLREQGKKLPKAAFCISPWLDMLGKGDSYTFNYSADDLFGHRKGQYSEELRQKFMNCGIYAFCIGMDRSNPLISPVYADYHDFPPMFFTAGGHELLLSDAMTVYDNCLKNGVKAQICIGDELFHVFPIFKMVIPEGKKAFNKILDFMKENR